MDNYDSIDAREAEDEKERQEIIAREEIGKDIDAWNERRREEAKENYAYIMDVGHIELDGQYSIAELESLVKQLRQLRQRRGIEDKED